MISDSFYTYYVCYVYWHTHTTCDNSCDDKILILNQVFIYATHVGTDITNAHGNHAVNLKLTPMDTETKNKRLLSNTLQFLQLICSYYCIV